jgi:hypothetical protein
MKKIRSILRSCILKAANYFGYSIIPIDYDSPIDLRALCNHPSALLYHSFARPILIDLDLHLGRGLRVLPLSAYCHPFVRALKEALGSHDREQTIRKELSHYYEHVKPTSAAEWLGLSENQSPVLFNSKPWALSMPWDKITPEEWRIAREQFAANENKSWGNKISIDCGWHFWGPVQDAKLEIEAERLGHLLSSIETKGLARHDQHDGDVRATILRKADGTWRWQVTGGEHRAAVMAALGYSSIPARVLQIVDRNDVDIWPGVLSGVFSKDAALASFDLIFEGSIPDVVKPWLETSNLSSDEAKKDHLDN